MNFTKSKMSEKEVNQVLSQFNKISSARIDTAIKDGLRSFQVFAPKVDHAIFTAVEFEQQEDDSKTAFACLYPRELFAK